LGVEYNKKSTLKCLFVCTLALPRTQEFLFTQQQQRPDLARLMQMTAQAQAAQLGPAGPAAAAAVAGIPPGLLPGHPGAPPVSATPVPPHGLPTTLSLLAGIPTSLATSMPAGGLPHPAFASLLAQQKPGLPHGAEAAAAAAAAAARAKEEELKRALESNGGKLLSKL